MRTKLPTLPCFPCPHASACCAYGTTLSEREAAELRTRHGEGTIYRTRWGALRTRVVRGRCVFFADGACSIHDDPAYPAICRGFPFTLGDGDEPYPYDETICPELDPARAATGPAPTPSARARRPS